MATGAKIADVFFRALLDDGQLQTQAIKSGTKAGDAMGKSMSARLGSAIGKTAFATIAAGAGIATRGLIELDSITADFVADTGASADEADRAKKAINEMAGDNLQSMREVGKTLTLVHTELGQTGEAAEKTAAKFLKYETATHQDSEAVKAFDDILDAWNLTADDSDEIMDSLIASHQKYGGSITENQQALAAMAPQLKALNADWRDGVGLLNLFAASGLDASIAQRALNTAVKNLKPGQTLDDLVREISAIPDPTKRAQKAIEIFGSRGGVALANALQPGIDSLGDFEISASDAAGATHNASDAIEHTFTNQVALRIKAIGSAIIGLGQTIGPLGSALTGIVSLGGALGFDKIFAKGFEKIGKSGVIKAAAKKAGLVIGAIYGAAAGAAEHLIELLKDAWEEIADSTVVKAVVGKAGSIVGSIYGTFTGAAAKLSETIANKWNVVIQSAFVKTAARNAGAVVGAIYGAAVGVSSKLGEVLATAWSATGGRILVAAGVSGTAAGTAFAAAAAAAALAAPLIVFLATIKLFDNGTPNPLGIPQIDQGNAKWQAFKDSLSHQGEDAGKAAGEATGKAYVDAAIDAASRQGQQGAEKFGDAMVAAFRKNLAGAGTVVSQVVSSSIAGGQQTSVAVAKELGRRVAGAIADGIKSQRDSWDQAWQDFIDSLTSVETPAKRAARLVGRLTSKELASGLNDSRPEVRARAEEVLQDTLDELNQIIAAGGKIGKKGMDALKTAMHSKNPDIRAAAKAIYTAATAKPSTIADHAYTWGKNLGKNIKNGMLSQLATIQAAARAIAAAMAAFLQTHSPAEKGPLSEDGGPEGWGRNIVGGVSRGVTGGIGGLSDAFAGLRAPSFGQLSVAGAAAGPAGAGTTQNFNLTVTGLVEAKNPLEIAQAMRRVARFGPSIERDRPTTVAKTETT